MEKVAELVRLASGLRLRKAQALVIFLTNPVGRLHRSELIVDLLWQDTESRKANASLRQTVRQIRLALEAEPWLEITTGSGMIGAVVTGNWSVEEELAAGLKNPDTFDQTAQNLRDYLHFLDLVLGISGNLDAWVSVVHSGLLSRLQDVLISHFEDPGDPQAAKAAALSLELEPHFEAAVRCLMKHYWVAGAAARAVKVYDRLYRHMDEAFDQEPETETIELLAAIKLAPDEGAATGQRAPREKISIRVVCAEQQFDNPGLTGFQNVLVSDLRDRLACFREWKVLAPESDEAEALRIVLTLQAGERGKTLFLEALSLAEEQAIWSTEVASPEVGWQDKVRDLIVQVADALEIVVADRHSSDMAANLYDDWLRALTLKGSWHKDDEAQAIAVLEDICARAPGFGPAHAELAGIYNVQHVLRPGTFQSDALATKALAHALKAMSIDQRDTRAHRVLAWCYCHRGEFDLAEFHFDQSLILNPQNPHTLASAALGFAFAHNHGRTADQIDAVTQRFDGKSPFHLIYLAAANYLLGHYAETVVQCEAGTALMTTVGGWHSAALAQLGRTDEARQRFDTFCADIKAVWCVSEPCTPEAVIDWFVACFPLRVEKDRQDLRRTLYSIRSARTEDERLVAHIGDVDANGAMES